MEPTDIDDKPRFYKRPTLVAKKSRDSIAYKEPDPDPPVPPASTSIYLQYRFEEENGNKENGNEENGNYDLTINGSPTFNNYVELDGIDDYLNVGIDFEVKTLSFWFNLNNVNTDNYLLSFDNDFYIKVNSNSLDFQFQPDIENNCNISKDFFNTIWYNLALTSNNENYDIYLNNTKLPETIIYKNLSSSTLNIGKYTGDEIHIKYLNGKIADLRLYNTIKTEDEINTIYNEYNYVNIYTHIPEQDIDYDFSLIATYNEWIAKAQSHNIQIFNFTRGIDNNDSVLSADNIDPNNFKYIQCYSTFYNNFKGLLLELPITHNYVEFTIITRSPSVISPTTYAMFIDTLEKLDQDIFISDANKNYKFEDNIEKFDEEYYYFAQFTSTTLVTKKYSYKPGHYLKIINDYSTLFDPNIKITLKKNYTEYPNLTFNENTLFDILVVGGGGGGGRNKNTDYRGGGGGGAGGLIHLQNYNISSGNYAIKVGNGGTKTSSIGNNGQNSSFYDLIAIGGGGGGAAGGVVVLDRNGRSGGSGGGGGDTGGIGGIAITNQGFNGGNAITGTESSGGGGGGGGGSFNAGSNYGNSVEHKGGSGGSGTNINITGINILYAEGGNGGSWYNGIDIEDATPNTGNGGHGNTTGKDAGNGGSGIVILKKVETNPPATGILTLNIVNDLDSGYTLDSSISSNYVNITKIILNVNANIYRNDKPENYGQAGLIIDLNSLTNLEELELNINPSKGIYGGPGNPGTSGDTAGGNGGDPIKIIGDRAILISYTEGAKLFKGGNGGNYSDWGGNVKVTLDFKVNNATYPKPEIIITNTDGLIGEFFNGNKKVKYNYNIITKLTHNFELYYLSVSDTDKYTVTDNTGINIFNDNNVYKLVYDAGKEKIDIYFVNKPAEGSDMTVFNMEEELSATPIEFNCNYPIIYDFSHTTSLADWNSYATDYGFNSTFDAGFQEASSIYYTGVWYHHTATGFISKEIPAGYTKLKVEYQALWDNTVSIYITPEEITGKGDITQTVRDTATVAEGLKIFEADINPTTDKYLTIAERYSTLSNNLKIVFY